VDAPAAGRLDRDAFAERFGGVFEHSPWIAAAAWERRPFSTVADLHAAMVGVVAQSPREQRLALIRAHPDLGTKARIGEESTREQAAAGLDRLTPAQYERITALTAAHHERFGFPFIVCARDHTPDSIIAAAEARAAAAPEAEERIALAEIAKIARLRLDDLLEGP
jgi:OHCU decarboxylase